MARCCILPLLFLFFCFDTVQSVISRLEGQEVYFDPDITGLPDEILWKHNGNKVAEFNLFKEQMFGSYEGRTTLDWHYAQLHISDLRLEDSGKYESEIYIHGKWHQSSYELVVEGVFNVSRAKDPQTDGEMERGPPTYINYTVISAIIIISTIIISVIIGGIIYIRRKHKAHDMVLQQLPQRGSVRKRGAENAKMALEWIFEITTEALTDPDTEQLREAAETSVARSLNEAGPDESVRKRLAQLESALKQIYDIAAEVLTGSVRKREEEIDKIALEEISGIIIEVLNGSVRRRQEELESALKLIFNITTETLTVLDQISFQNEGMKELDEQSTPSSPLLGQQDTTNDPDTALLREAADTNVAVSSTEADPAGVSDNMTKDTASDQESNSTFKHPDPEREEREAKSHAESDFSGSPNMAPQDTHDEHNNDAGTDYKSDSIMSRETR